VKRLVFRVIKDTFKLSKRFVIISLIAGFFSAIFPLISVYISREIINQLSQTIDYTDLMKFITIGLSLIFVSQIISGLFNYIHQFEQAEFYMKLEIVRNLKSIDMEFQYVEDPAIKDLRQKITIIGYSGTGSYEMIANRLKDFVYYFVSIIGAVWLILPAFLYRTNTIYDSWVFLIALIALLSGSSYLTAIYHTKQNQKLKKLFETIHHANTMFNYLADMLLNPENGKEIRLYRQQSHIQKWFDDDTGQKGSVAKMIRAIHQAWSNTQMFSLSINQVVVLFLYLLVALKGLKGGLPLGQIVAATASLNILIAVLSEAVTQFSMSLSDSAGINLHYEYMDLPNQTQIGSIPVEKRLDYDYQLSAKQVSFTYPGTQKEVLSDISIDFEVGRSYAIVGENGSGKTTFIKLLTRLYDPSEGEILLNGIAANKYDADQYYSIFNVVFQDFDLFSFQLGESIATSQVVDESRAIQAIKDVGFWERYQQLPKGLDTSLNKEFDSDGITLSGGEQQKIALARAIYNDGPIYVLDEPTAALDPISEFEIYQHFQQMTKGKTSLIISHRLSSCRFSDEILVFDRGKIVQRGSHEELVHVPGKYADLWHAQAKHYQAEEVDLSKLGIREVIT
jgi:ATP-binding cassette subfamily B protein